MMGKRRVFLKGGVVIFATLEGGEWGKGELPTEGGTSDPRSNHSQLLRKSCDRHTDRHTDRVNLIGHPFGGPIKCSARKYNGQLDPD